MFYPTCDSLLQFCHVLDIDSIVMGALPILKGAESHAYDP